MLDLPETKANLANLGGYWLGVHKLDRTEKDLTKFPEFTDDVKAALQQSSQLFVQDLLGQRQSGGRGHVQAHVPQRDAGRHCYGIPGVTAPT